MSADRKRREAKEQARLDHESTSDFGISGQDISGGKAHREAESQKGAYGKTPVATENPSIGTVEVMRRAEGLNAANATVQPNELLYGKPTHDWTSSAPIDKRVRERNFRIAEKLGLRHIPGLFRYHPVACANHPDRPEHVPKRNKEWKRAPRRHLCVQCRVELAKKAGKAPNFYLYNE